MAAAFNKLVTPSNDDYRTVQPHSKINIANGGVDQLTAKQWTIWLEGARRFGTIIYLFSIMLGLVTIAKVIRFQTFRIREIAHTE